MFPSTTAPARGAEAPVVYDPVADRAAIVIDGPARVTVLTSRLVRLEWSGEEHFEDRASLVFINRRLPVPQFTTRVDDGWRIIDTGDVVVRFRRDRRRFSASNLEIQFAMNGGRRTWRPGTPNHGNLRGTTRTLDAVDGATELEPGLLSRDGWSVVDDSTRPLFDDGDWPWVVSRNPGAHQDWYFFGYGHDYKGLLRDFTSVAGRIPLPPRFAFGAWWSRYWAYSADDLKQLVAEFETHDVPLDVMVIDMDWHVTCPPTTKKDSAKQKPGWTGYTWNRDLFPDPPALLASLHRKGLQITLNLHPASGIQPHEEQYADMARAMGIDPSTGRYVPFDIVNRRFAESYFALVTHPLEAQGVDFWWLDWQQGATTNIRGVTPTWWLNYVHFTDMARAGKKRQIIFHRWGGLGNHRYQIGFSGDTIITWDSLAFQPYFTATAANVGFGYWSHDIGGHMRGVKSSPEMYTRWIQFGVFSPILRTHATKDAAIDRRIWTYAPEYFNAMREAIILRYALIPYIYTAARTTYDSGVSIVRPLYYEYPECDEAYSFTDEYMFGTDMMVAPIVAPMPANSQVATRAVWIPPGEWIEWYSGARFAGPTIVERRFTLAEIPVYVRAGAIVPMQPRMRHTGETPVDPLILKVFPGANGATSVYEDEGNNVGYEQGRFAWTPVRHSLSEDGEMTIDIGPAEGDYLGMLPARGYEIHLLDTPAPTRVTIDGERVRRDASGADSWRLDSDGRTTIVTVGARPVREALSITVASACESVPPGGQER